MHNAQIYKQMFYLLPFWNFPQLLETVLILLLLQTAECFPKSITGLLSIPTAKMRLTAAPIRGNEWARLRGLNPGFGGIWPGNPDAKTYKVVVKSKKCDEEFTLNVPEDRYIYFYFEEQGIELPIVNSNRMCRQGCCTICTGKVLEGKVKMDAPLGLLKDLRDKNYSLTCCSYPRSDLVILISKLS